MSFSRRESAGPREFGANCRPAVVAFGAGLAGFGGRACGAPFAARSLATFLGAAGFATGALDAGTFAGGALSTAPGNAQSGKPFPEDARLATAS
mmetsp:Transcript_103708/g.237502  ORF Transcript_103708/g.237502 Transcript_103708/m.237502 type:complete len:94 (-) Transcript_103708:416-697(-)